MASPLAPKKRTFSEPARSEDLPSTLSQQDRPQVAVSTWPTLHRKTCLALARPAGTAQAGQDEQESPEEEETTEDETAAMVDYF